MIKNDVKADENDIEITKKKKKIKKDSLCFPVILTFEVNKSFRNMTKNFPYVPKQITQLLQWKFLRDLQEIQKRRDIYHEILEIGLKFCIFSWL